jgi:conjugal transfer mating pair stabilization protein TraG
MTYEIYVYGSGEILKSVFDAIAICINGKTGSLFIALRNLGLIVGIFWATIYALYRDLTTVFTNWIVPMSLMMNLLFIPQTCLWIHDPITKYSQKVDNVPYGLVAFSSYVNKIGHVITQEIEKVFSLPDDLKYHKSGYIFGCQLIEQAKSFRITNATLNENMREFVGHCVVYDVLLGNKYSLDELKTSDDVWGLVSTNASPVRMFLWKDLINQEQSRGKAKACLVTCQEGVKKFNQLWNQELERASDFYGKKIFGKNSLIPRQNY